MAKGSIETLKTGFRARVYVGIDPLTKKQIYLRGKVRPTETDAAIDLSGLLADAKAKRTPDTSATVAHMLNEWMKVADIELTTEDGYEGYIRRILKPALGEMTVRQLADHVEVLDRMYSELRRCSKLCKVTGVTIDHRTHWEHDCRLVRHHKRREHDCEAVGCRVIACKPHTCKPAAVSTIRQINAILSAAYGYAITWRWADRNPAALAHLPKQRGRKRAKPQDADQVAALLNLAFAELPDFGLYLWLAATTGARRGELAALRWCDVDLERGLLLVDENFVVRKGQRKFKGTKTEEQAPRPLSLDTLSVALLTEFKTKQQADLAPAGLTLPDDALVFSPEPDGSTAWNPQTFTHRYERFAKRLNIAEPMKNLRHFSATQLLSSGFDLKTVADRLGHADGGVTTLRFYADSMPRNDKRAAEHLATNLHQLRTKAAGATSPQPVESEPTTDGSTRTARRLRRQVVVRRSMS
jgi:integrase